MSGMESTDDSQESAFDGYVEVLIEVIGHADRAEPLRDYCTGLMMPVARESVEPRRLQRRRALLPSISLCCIS
jgi:SRSO17 transposase